MYGLHGRKLWTITGLAVRTVIERQGGWWLADMLMPQI